MNRLIVLNIAAVLFLAQHSISNAIEDGSRVKPLLNMIMSGISSDYLYSFKPGKDFDSYIQAKYILNQIRQGVDDPHMIQAKSPTTAADYACEAICQLQTDGRRFQISYNIQNGGKKSRSEIFFNGVSYIVKHDSANRWDVIPSDPTRVPSLFSVLATPVFSVGPVANGITFWNRTWSEMLAPESNGKYAISENKVKNERTIIISCMNTVSLSDNDVRDNFSMQYSDISPPVLHRMSSWRTNVNNDKMAEIDSVIGSGAIEVTPGVVVPAEFAIPVERTFSSRAGNLSDHERKILKEVLPSFDVEKKLDLGQHSFLVKRLELLLPSQKDQFWPQFDKKELIYNHMTGISSMGAMDNK